MVKNTPVNARELRDSSLIPVLGTSPGGGHGNPFQYSCLENSIVRGAWEARVCGVEKSQTQLTNTLTYLHAGKRRACLGQEETIYFHRRGLQMLGMSPDHTVVVPVAPGSDGAHIY